MINYTEVADKIVSRLGEELICSWIDHRGKVYQLSGMGEQATSAEEVCHDWRVAGWCIEDYLNRHFTDWDDLRPYWTDDDLDSYKDKEPFCLGVILAYLRNTKND